MAWHPSAGYETTYVELLAGLWDDLEDLLDAHYGQVSRDPGSDERLRLKLAELRLRLVRSIDDAGSATRDGGEAGASAEALRRFAFELLRLLDFDRLDEHFELSCGPTMLLAQHRILDEAQRIATAR